VVKWVAELERAVGAGGGQNACIDAALSFHMRNGATALRASYVGQVPGWNGLRKEACDAMWLHPELTAKCQRISTTE
jgi:hypothetical protein